MHWKKWAASLGLTVQMSLSMLGCDPSGGGGGLRNLGGDELGGTGGAEDETNTPRNNGSHSGGPVGNDSLTDLFSGGASEDVRECKRWVKADIVALDQVIVYNRWGAFNPVGMMFALRRDVESTDGSNNLEPGKVRLEKDERPRPLVLRVNKGDCLKVKFTNLLDPNVLRVEDAPETAEMATGQYPYMNDIVGEDVPWHRWMPLTNYGMALGVALPPGNALGDGPGSIDGDGDGIPDMVDGRTDAPATRAVGFHVQGLQYRNIDSDGANVGDNDSSLADPGETREYSYLADREGTFLFLSGAHLAGGEGDNAALASGLFGAVNVEPEGSRWYRSQVTERDLDRATRGRNPDGTPKIDFEATHNGKPILNMLDDDNEIVHGDLTAIIAHFKETEFDAVTARSEGVFREFTTVFHDEIQVVQAFPELDEDRTLESLRDAFAINYGTDAVGPRVLANRRRIGPNKNCVECNFEEFFLSSWPSGDPSIIVEKDEDGRTKKALYPDDPSNVYHAYLGDPVWFRNQHAGPRETHVFHLHAHQWLHTPGDDDSSYLDAQSISPGSAFTYVINFGGGGNRNFTVGDAIFHCHLYPHFAAGMWALWRNHDVFEDGSEKRNLPDGEIKDGTPTPALVPLPGRPMPPMPTYKETEVKLANGSTVTRPAFPGYPFYLAAIAGHRPPQPPLDLEFDGGLQRHIVTRTLEADVGDVDEFDFNVVPLKINIKLLEEDGTPLERNAMDFHAGDLEGARRTTSRYGFPAAAYPAFTPEGNRSEFLVNGQGAEPGAPFANPCPRGTPEREYLTAVIQLDLIVNNDGWHDPQGRILALEQDVDGLIGGTASPTPLVMRFNSGECGIVHTTNLLPDRLEEDDFQIGAPTDTVGQHVHLVKFDVTSSDGATNGFNYEDGVFAADVVQQRIRAANQAGGAFEADGTTKERGDRIKLKAERHPRVASAPVGTQTGIQRWWADPILNGEGQDKTVGTTFTHDHFSPSSHQQHGLDAGLAVQPAGSSWRDSRTGEPIGTRSDGGPMPALADILTLDPNDSYREYNLTFHDFALLYDRKGRPINPPNDQLERLPIAIDNVDDPVPEGVSADDPGSMMVNYRNEPIPLRITTQEGTRFQQKKGPEGDMENVFRSDIHGDPATPLLRAYAGDKVHFRILEGAQEEFHYFNVHGMKWLAEYADPDSGFSNGQGFAISEHFEFLDRIPPLKRATADYLWQSAATDDLWNGQWGLLRTYRDLQPDLQPLPGNPIFGNPNAPDHPVCPSNAPKRKYTVYAITADGNLPDDKLVYNERFDLFDPDGILYVRAEHIDEVMKGKRRPEPLILRANAGDCIEVTLINAFPDKMPKTPHWNFLPVITERFNVNQVRSSNHASLHPQLVEYDVTESDGANIGLNPVQTVAPGETRTYRWFAGRWRLKNDPGPVQFPLQPSTPSSGPAEFEAIPVEYGAVALRDVADVVNHGMHGGIGALIIEPVGATWKTDEDTEASATVFYADSKGTQRKYREFVLLFQDEIGLHSNKEKFQCVDENLNCGTALLTYGALEDPEESGHKGFNYRTEPLWARVGIPPELALEVLNDIDQSQLLDSKDFGDPETPIFEADEGDEVRFRIVQPSGHPRAAAFHLHGHEWQHDAWATGTDSTVIGENVDSNIIGVQGTQGPMVHWNILPLYGAGGANKVRGDFLYRNQNSVQFPEGMWGIFRVK